MKRRYIYYISFFLLGSFLWALGSVKPKEVLTFFVSEERATPLEVSTPTYSDTEAISVKLRAGSSNMVTMRGLRMFLPAGSLKRDVRLSVRKLNSKELHSLPLSFVNLTRDAGGYSFRPRNILLQEEAELSIAYDKTKIPEGYTAKDIAIFYYDYDKRHWQQLSTTEVDEEKHIVKGKTKTFSDFIAGIIKLPESPDTSGFMPTSISGLKAANPLGGVQSIAPPTANAEGSATTSFNIELPQGRGGMQPNISLQYSSDGGHSWLGQGWNLSFPSVSIDTRWGAPRYDEAKETESYTLAGEELLPNTHRADWEDRSANKRFYPRREASFSKIIRQGNSPKHYHWEVSSKSGITSYYGTAADSRLQSAEGNIGYWGITSQEDLKGNNIQYEYEKVDSVLYPKAIYYTGHQGDKGKYSVRFISDKDLGEPLRNDVQISARLGFKQEYKRLLRKIEVRYAGAMVRSYELIYKKGAYEKTLLSEIKQYDAEGKEFYANTLSYYDDVRDASGNYIPFGELKKWEVPKDGIKYSILGLNGLSGKPTLAGTSNSESGGVNFRVGVGITGVGQKYENTIGGHGGSSRGKTHSKVLLQDLDGDHLPDKVYIEDSRVYYRKNLSASGHYSFGVKQLINLSTLGRTRSSSYNYGVGLSAQIEKVGVNIGYDRQKSTSTTESYFMDFNGDGLVDFAQGGIVYYNRLENGIPTFYPSSTGTPAPVTSSGEVLNLPVQPSLTKKELEEKNPLHDIVRVWIAPHTGKVRIKHQYQLIEDTSPERRAYQNNDGTPRADGVVLYFQHRKQLLWKEKIAAEDYSFKTKQDELNIKKGETLYFRVSSVFDGNYDTVDWLPEIDYVDLPDEKDENGLRLKYYNPEQDFFHTSEGIVGFAETVNPVLKGIFKKKATTDKVILKVYKTNTETDQRQLVLEKTFDEKSLDFDLSSLPLGRFSENEILSIQIESPTEIDWRAVDVEPQVEYSLQGKTFTERLGVDYSIYARVDDGYILQSTLAWQKGKVALSLTSASNNVLKDEKGNLLNGEIVLTGKTDNKSVSRTRYEVRNGILIDKTTVNDRIDKEVGISTPMYWIINTSSIELYRALKKANYELSASINGVSNGVKYQNFKVFVPFKSPDVETKFGKAFRGWGSFIVNGAKAGELIDESLLQDQYGNYDENNPPDTDPNHFNPDVEQPQLEASNVYFVRTRGAVIKEKTPYRRYIGTEPEIFVSGNRMVSARLGENDLKEYLDTTLPVLQGSVSPALFIVSKGESKVISYGGSITINKGSGALGKSESWGSSSVTQTMNDFNGDRFPDFVRGGKVQYTTPRGGISIQTQHIGDFSYSKSSSQGGSVNGIYKHAIVKTSDNNTSTPNDDQKKSATTKGAQDADKIRGNLSLSAGVGLSTSSDHAEQGYIDVNGDGLADRITPHTVAYNTGYGFLAEEALEIGSINKGESQDVSGGPSLGFLKGFSKWAGSISGGYTLGKSTTHIKTQFLDLTGDGLLDKIEYGDFQIKVYPNLGNRWGAFFILPQISSEQTGRNVSISHGGSVNFAVDIPIPPTSIRITAGGGGSYGTNTNRMEATFMDVDGDGHLDYVLSEDEDDLRVARSSFRRTNMLKGVENAAGNSWEIDYEWKAPTYENPNSQWVLKEVKLFDGHTGDGEDWTISKFEYENPYYDRRERTFYGFEKIKQQAINPKDNSVLRTSVQEFFNRDYFRKSVLKYSAVLDKNGAKLSETSVKYHIANARTGASVLPSELFLPALDSESIFIAPSEEIHREYEDKEKPQKKTNALPAPKPITKTPSTPNKGRSEKVVMLRVPQHTRGHVPYLFNAKELDFETGLYYYGARYYDPRTSLWLNTDPLSGYNPIQEVEHYINGQHNGGIYNPMNHNTYGYTYNNPIMFVDPNGKQNLPQLLEDGINYIHETKIGRKIYRAGNRISEDAQKQLLLFSPLGGMIKVGELADAYNRGDVNTLTDVARTLLKAKDRKRNISNINSADNLIKFANKTERQPRNQKKINYEMEGDIDIIFRNITKNATSIKSEKNVVTAKMDDGQVIIKRKSTSPQDYGNTITITKDGKNHDIRITPTKNE